MRYAVSRWLRWSLFCRLGMTADPLDSRCESTDSQQVQTTQCDDSHMPILLDSPTSISFGHSDEFAESPTWWHAGKFVVALTAQSIGDCPEVIRMSKSQNQNLLAHVAVWWVMFEQKNGHHRPARKEKRKYRLFRMSRSWKKTLVPSSKFLLVPDDGSQAWLVASWVVDVLQRQKEMAALSC